VTTIETKAIVGLLFLAAIVAGISSIVFYRYALPAAIAADNQGKSQYVGTNQGFVQAVVTDKPVSNQGTVGLTVTG